MILIFQLLCIISAGIVFSILYLCNPINSNMPSAIMTSVLAVFFGMGALSIKESIGKKGATVPLSSKIIGLIVLLGIFGYSSKYFMAMWNGEKVSPENQMNEAAMVASMDSTISANTDSASNTASLIDQDENATYSSVMADEEINNTPLPSARAVMIWLILVCIFLIWIMIKGGEATQPGKK